MAQAFNPGTSMGEAGRSLGSRAACSTQVAPGQPWIHRETMSQKKKIRGMMKAVLRWTLLLPDNSVFDTLMKNEEAQHGGRSISLILTSFPLIISSSVVADCLFISIYRLGS